MNFSPQGCKGSDKTEQQTLTLISGFPSSHAVSILEFYHWIAMFAVERKRKHRNGILAPDMTNNAPAHISMAMASLMTLPNYKWTDSVVSPVSGMEERKTR